MTADPKFRIGDHVRVHGDENNKEYIGKIRDSYPYRGQTKYTVKRVLAWAGITG